MPPSTPATPSPSHLRRHAATLVLVVACLGTVATSPPQSPPVFAEHTGPTVRLTQDAPRSTRRFIIRLSARDSSETARGTVDAELTARWRPADATASPGPELRARLDRVDEPHEPSRTYDLETPDTPRDVDAGAIFLQGCRLDEACEEEVELDLEVVGDLGEGTVDVDWRLRAQAHTDTDEAPKGFTVHILEP